MKNIQNKIISIIICISLMSCSFGGYNQNKDFNLKEVDNLQTEGYGIVIMKLGNFETRAMNRKNIIAVRKEKPIAQTKWCNENKDCFYTNPRNGNSFAMISLNSVALFFSMFGLYSSGGYYDDYYKTFPEGYIALKIKSGNYYLKSFEWQNGDGLTMPDNTLTFKLLSNEVLYIGDISIKTCNKTFEKQSFYIETQDNFETAILYTLSKFPQIKPEQIEKRLIVVGENAKEDKCKI